MLQCKDKVAVITGTTSGIGLATAKKLMEEGATIYPLVWEREIEVMEQIIEDWKGLGPGRMATNICFDAAKIETIRPAIKKVYQKAGRIDIFINNAIATSPEQSSADTTIVDTNYQTMMRLYKGIMGVSSECARAAIPLMIKNGGGSFVSTSSTTSKQADLARSYYGISKAAINLMTKDIALQYGRQGIRCNAVLPGFTATKNALEFLPKEFIESWLKHAPLRRLGTPEDQANAIVFLAGNQSEWITGQCLEVNGGFGLGSPMFGDLVDAHS